MATDRERLLVGIALQVGADIMHQNDAVILEKPEDISKVTNDLLHYLENTTNLNKTTADIARDLIVKFEL